ncbi:hypothetical protein HDK77DRAFT_424282 [Phyllosticta capitalensis]
MAPETDTFPHKRTHRRNPSSTSDAGIFVSPGRHSAPVAPVSVQATMKSSSSEPQSLVRPPATKSKNVLTAFENLVEVGIQNLISQDMLPRVRFDGPYQARHDSARQRTLQPHEWTDEMIKNLDKIVHICKDVDRARKLLHNEMQSRQAQGRLRGRVRLAEGLLMTDVNQVLHYLRTNTTWDTSLAPMEDTSDVEDMEKSPLPPQKKVCFSSPAKESTAAPITTTNSQSPHDIKVINDLNSMLLKDLNHVRAIRLALQDKSTTLKTEHECRTARTKALARLHEVNMAEGMTSLEQLKLEYAKHSSLQKQDQQARLAHEHVLVADRAAALYKAISEHVEVVLPDSLKGAMEWLQPSLSRTPKPAPQLGSFKPQGKKRKVFEESDGEDSFES